jgi:hypothetical protein
MIFKAKPYFQRVDPFPMFHVSKDFRYEVPFAQLLQSRWQLHEVWRLTPPSALAWSNGQSRTPNLFNDVLLVALSCRLFRLMLNYFLARVACSAWPSNKGFAFYIFRLF